MGSLNRKVIHTQGKKMKYFIVTNLHTYFFNYSIHVQICSNVYCQGMYIGAHYMYMLFFLTHLENDAWEHTICLL